MGLMHIAKYSRFKQGQLYSVCLKGGYGISGTATIHWPVAPMFP